MKIQDYIPQNDTPRSETIGAIAKAIADAVVMDLSIVGISLQANVLPIIKEWQDARKAYDGIHTLGEKITCDKRMFDAEAALAAVVCK